MNRTDLESSILSKVKSANNRIALQWCTSLGKSKMAINIANRIIQLGNFSKFNVLIVVAETAHKGNWREELAKWGPINNSEITMECYQSLKKCTNISWDLIIFDEAHHLKSDLRLELLDKISSNNILLLSATLPVSLLQQVSVIFGDFLTSTVSLQEGIDWNFIPSPKIILVPLILDTKNYKECVIKEWGAKKDRKVIRCLFEDRWKYIKHKDLYPNVTLEIVCTEYQKYNYISSDLDYYKRQFLRTKSEVCKNKWLLLGSQRKRFLGELKTNNVYPICKKLRKSGLRFLCFCASIKQAEEIGKENAIHSNKTNSPEIISKFNNKEINELYTVGMLQEGQNLADIQASIIIQLDNEERAFIQKFGRALRAEYPLQYILYYQNTRDEEYLKKITEGIDPNYIINLQNIKENEN